MEITSQETKPASDTPRTEMYSGTRMLNALIVKKQVDHLATKCDRMLYHDYTRRHNEVVKCLHMLVSNKYNITPKPRKRIRGYSVQEVMANDRVEIRVDTRIKTTGKISHDRQDIMVLDRGWNNQASTRKYDLLASKAS
ncbi:hypothetical protein GINT2_001523 [Glugoides intestinalis]